MGKRKRIMAIDRNYLESLQGTLQSGIKKAGGYFDSIKDNLVNKKDAVPEKRNFSEIFKTEYPKLIQKNPLLKNPISDMTQRAVGSFADKVIGGTQQALKGEKPYEAEKSVLKATEKNKIYKENLAKGMKPEEAMKAASNKQLADESMNMVMGFVGNESGVIKKIADPIKKAETLGFKTFVDDMGGEQEVKDWANQFWAKKEKPGVFYHVTEGDKFSVFDKTKSMNYDPKLRNGGISMINGLYVGPDKNALQQFYGVDKDIKTLTFKGNPKLLDLTNRVDEEGFIKEVMKKFGVKDRSSVKLGDAMEKELSERGYDGAKYFDPYATGDEIVITNPNVFNKTEEISPLLSEAKDLTWARGTRAAGIQNAGLKNYNEATRVLEKAGELPKEIKMGSVTKDTIKDYYLTKKPPVVGDVFINSKGERIEITKVGDNDINYFLKGKNKGIEGKVYFDSQLTDIWNKANLKNQEGKIGTKEAIIGGAIGAGIGVATPLSIKDKEMRKENDAKLMTKNKFEGLKGMIGSAPTSKDIEDIRKIVEKEITDGDQYRELYTLLLQRQQDILNGDVEKSQK